ncbi:calcium-binding protein [Trichormus sp. NMC-1]|uniref:calcium-binding protein n=1 Tax=Trichormus sp. NMC-1 TaxID=1853259 RepID=UPI0008DBEB0B|nr:calcium-binding protein [Trichormus sp. NMC-1]
MVQGNSLDTETLQALKAEDDHGTIAVNGQVIQVEQQNFTGTNGNDTITGTSGNDTINTGLGIDNANGAAGDDLLIIDYSIGDTGRGMTLSTYAGTEGFYGSAYRLNSAGNGYPDRVDFSGINRFQITGTGANDTITTGSGNDIINGGEGEDTVNAGGGNDTIDGVNGASLTPGLGEVDVHTGGTGSDRFILGNATKVYYDDGNTLTNGSSDYGDITDFNTGDIIQLQGTSSNYLLTVVGASAVFEFAYLGNSDITLSSSNFSLVA